MKEGTLDRKYMFFINYSEFIFLIYFAYLCKFKLKSKYSKILVFLTISILPSIISFKFISYSSIYFLLLLLLIPFLLEWSLKQQYLFTNVNIEKIVLSLIVAGLFTKFHQGYVHGQDSYAGSFIYGLLSRGGGVNASNHIGGILLVFYPLLHRRSVKLIVILFLLICFSRGIYITFTLIILVNLFYTHKITFKSFLYFIIFLFLTFVIFIQFPHIYNEFTTRLITFSLIFENDRFTIFYESIKLFVNSFFLGVGPTNFYYALNSANNSFEFSNAHNMFITVLVENGVFFSSVFIFLIFNLFKDSFKIQRKYMMSLFVFCFYGLFSGQLYECSLGKVSFYDFFYLIFIISLITNKYLKKNNHLSAITYKKNFA